MALENYVKNGKILLLRNPDLTDESSSENEEYEVKQQSDGRWCWQDDSGQYQPYDLSVHHQLDALPVGNIHLLNINNTTYEIQKNTINEAVQLNHNNNSSRKVRRVSKNNNIHNNQNSKLVNNHNAHNQELEYVWYYALNNGTMQSCSYDLSLHLNDLQIGQTYITFINGTQYRFTKSAKDLCSQTDIKSNQSRTVICQKAPKKKNNSHSSCKQYTNHQKHSYKKGKWFYFDSYGKEKPCTNYISSKLDQLAMTKPTIMSIGDQGYLSEMTKISHDVVQQKNMKSGTVRHLERK